MMSQSGTAMTDGATRFTSGPRRILTGLLVLIVATFVVDVGWYQCRKWIPKLGAANGSVHRIRLFVIPGKANKVEYQVDAVRPEEDVTCSHSLFPQGGNRPCWYVKKHANDPIPM
jgi:hypothetical protein